MDPLLGAYHHPLSKPHSGSFKHCSISQIFVMDHTETIKNSVHTEQNLDDEAEDFRCGWVRHVTACGVRAAGLLSDWVNRESLYSVFTSLVARSGGLSKQCL